LKIHDPNNVVEGTKGLSYLTKTNFYEVDNTKGGGGGEVYVFNEKTEENGGR
jgi:hypothetical protein